MVEEGSASKSPRRRRWRSLLVLLLLGLLLVGGTLGYRHYWLARPVGEGPAGPSVPREPFARVWNERKVLLLGVGDSVTAGFGVAKAHGYVARLASNPDDEFPEMQGLCLGAVLPNLRVKNVAVSGSTSLQHLETLEYLEKQDADVFGIVVMTTGGNDLIHDYGRRPPREGAMFGATLEEATPWIENFQNRLSRMIDLVESKFPGGCLIFLGDIYDPTDGIGDGSSAGLPDWPDGLKIHDRYNEILRACADQRKSVVVAPIHDTFLGHGTHCVQFWRQHYRRDDPTYWYAWSLEDPNDRGFDAIRRLFLIEIAKKAELIGGSSYKQGQ